MIFLTSTDFDALIDQEELDYISKSVQANIDTAELAAIDEMTGYLNVRFDPAAIFSASGTDRSSSIVMYCTDIAIYHMHTSISPDNVPELRETRYKNAIGWCEKLADGFINPILPIKQTEPSDPIRFGNSKEKDDQYY